ncbi:hypothetical protein [Pelagicoccus mobilis]|uniref:Uncharacterized protein n=1 Tax=Pelagicoccus mobilis TaxID=415221 RepID=A0A934S235_9BACT|nr:hypothetical protein [Pelagicoccus mobilis]MBK1879659.1 hypothetical protein [Pelagicoccus mobilis]
MAWRIDKHVVRGLIQNIVPGRVVGTVWLKGLNQPIELNLKGNCYRDLAGTRLEFKNPHPIEGDYTGFDVFQEGNVGDMTASKKVKTLLDFDEESEELPESPAFKLANCLYLEWFSESNGRVLIETTDFSWKVSLPKWTLSEDDERDQQEANKQAMFNFMDELSRALTPAEQSEEPAEEDMDEFQWEAYLQKTDARSDMLLELFEKYENDPDCEEIIAKAMGWEIESMEVTEEFFEEWDIDQNQDSKDPDSEYLPNHPLISRMMDITSQLYYEAESRKLFTEDTNNPWNQLIWHGQMTVSKLIAALEEVAEGIETEPGFVVATLKRALHLLHLTIATMEACVSIDPDEHRWTNDIRKELFTLRESIIDTMQSYRQQ